MEKALCTLRQVGSLEIKLAQDKSSIDHLCFERVILCCYRCFRLITYELFDIFKLSISVTQHENYTQSQKLNKKFNIFSQYNLNLIFFNNL